MSLNPELLRNLWLELTPQRLVAAPVILGLIAAVVLLLGEPAAPQLYSIFDGLFTLMALLWGTRRAAAALVDEIDGRTWDGQRLSALGAWSMTWGKLLGGTAFVWYCGGIALAVAVLGLSQMVSAAEVGQYLLVSLAAAGFAQAFALLAALALLRRARGATRGIVTLSQLAGLGLGLAVWHRLGGILGLDRQLGIPVGLIELEWHGLEIDGRFVLASLAVFLFWAVLGCTRLMRVELQYRTRPWAWIAFLVFVVAYGAGFAYGGPVRVPDALDDPMTVPLAALLPLVYLGLFIEPIEWRRQRAFLGALARPGGGRLWAAVPLWALSYLALLVSAALYLALFEGSDGLAGPAALLFAMLLFVLRDGLLVLWLTLGGESRRALPAALVYLVCLYGLSTALLVALDLERFAPVVYPNIERGPVWAVVPVLLQAALMAVLVGQRWRGRLAGLRSA